MPELSEGVKKLTAQYKLWQKSQKPKEGVPTIHVDEVASKVASFYEQIRTIIDWKEEHLMRRAAIIRKLKRRFLDLELNNFSVESTAEPLVLELIRGGFFSNDKIEESKIQDVKKILEKYVFILKNNPEYKKGRAGLQFYTKLLEIAACEIEETLSPSIKEMALIDFMFSAMREKIKVSEEIYERGFLKPEQADILTYVAVQQSLFKLDSPIISYNLLRYKYKPWDNPSGDGLLKISQNIFKILHNLERDLSHPLLKKFYVICEKYDTPYLLIGDILSADNIDQAAKEMKEPPLLEIFVRRAYSKRLRDLKARIKRGAIYSTLSIFITKILTLFILEVVISKLIFKEALNPIFLVADVLIPTGLMAILVMTARPPSSKNLNLVIMESMKIVYPQEKQDTYKVKVSKPKSTITKIFLSLIYLCGAALSATVMFGLFSALQFPLSSIIIDFIFIALILFAGTAVQKRAQELTVEDEREGFLGFLSDILFLPLTDVGRWMSQTWKQYNAIAALFNALVDMPFSAFVEFIERWRYFLKEKKEELR